MNKKILLVEDEEDILELLFEVFSNYGNYQAFCARDGEEALKLARDTVPDVILLDVQIPIISGHEVCRRLKNDPALCKAKVLMLSGYTAASDRQKALETGADGYITKPFRPAALIKKVEQVLRDGNE